MFGLFNNKTAEDKKRDAFLKIRAEIWETYHDKDKNIREELKRYEFLIESLYKTKNIDNINAGFSEISKEYTNEELIKELGIFNKDEEEKIIKWSNKYNELINNRNHIIAEYNGQIKELKEKLDEYYK